VEALAGQLRIGELSRRVGVTPELLRAWERRYGLLQPTRSAGGFRLYSDADEARVREMQRHLGAGLSAAQAARAVLEQGDSPETAAAANPGESAAALQETLERYDEAGAHSILDRSFATFSTEAVLVDIVTPVLHSLGERWAAGQLTIAQEHFASSVLRGRLLGLARGWGRGTGPLAVLACPPGEQHDLPLLLFGIPLRQTGWRIVFLGGETPISTVERAVAAVAPRAVVLSAARPEPLLAVEHELAALATRVAVAIGGQGADAALAERAGAVLLDGNPVEAANSFAERILP
jgi:MerR family transcriptional regulator, light-induced transcriptional regulator